MLLFVGLAAAMVRFDVSKDRGSRLVKRGSNNSREILLENTVSYYQTELLIGSPPQRVEVQIDTGSSDLWVISSTNPLCGTAHTGCAWRSTFDADRSQTFRANRSQSFGITYGDMTFASGYFAQDDIMMGGQYSSKKEDDEDSEVGAFMVTSANFALAERANSSEAVWGIGMESTETIARNVGLDGKLYPTYSNLPMQMKQQGLIDSVAYSLWLNDLQSVTGSLLFGGIDHAKYTGELQKVPLVSSYRDIKVPIDFSVMLSGISVYNADNTSVQLVESNVPVLLDSGTTYCQLPMPILAPIAGMLKAYHDRKNNVFIISNSRREEMKNGGVTFNLSGIAISVPIDELLIPMTPLNTLEPHSSDDYLKWARKSSGSYLLGILPSESNVQPTYILGDTFLRSAYVVYDLHNKEIAIANAAHNSTKSDTENIGPEGIPRAAKAPLYSSTNINSEITTFSASDIYLSNDGKSTTVSPVQTGLRTLADIPSRTIVSTGTSVSQSTSKADHGHKQKNQASKPGCLLLAACIGVLLNAVI